MVKIAVVSHIVLDTINNINSCNNEKYRFEALGGSASYCGLMLKELGCEVELITKVGYDFPRKWKEYLYMHGLKINNFENYPTTRFLINQDKFSRSLYLRSKCSNISIDDVVGKNVDGWIVTPVIDEVPVEILYHIVKSSDFVMLDPQGYTRHYDSNGQIRLKKKINLDVNGVSAIKLDKNEYLTMRSLIQDIKYIITTDTKTIRLNDYQILLNDIDTPDSTGVGDILSATFSFIYLKENNPLLAFCFAAGAVKAALEMKSFGIFKIPSRKNIQSFANDFYNSL